jgi:hypothetical protein
MDLTRTLQRIGTAGAVSMNSRRRRFTGPGLTNSSNATNQAPELSAIKTTAGSTAIGDRLSVSLSRRLRFTGASTMCFGKYQRSLRFNFLQHCIACG